MRSDVIPGAVFPDYELSDHTARRRKLSDLQREDAMVLVLARGGYCPRDRRQHEGLLQLERELEVGYCRVEELRQDLRAVTRKCRPDWDISRPELVAAWKEGRKELFHPYGKSYVETLRGQDGVDAAATGR